MRDKDLDDGRLYTDDETEFIFAVRAYQMKTGRKFLASTEFLAVTRGLGYRKPKKRGH